jgi:hypothetical protein
MEFEGARVSLPLLLTVTTLLAGFIYVWARGGVQFALLTAGASVAGIVTAVSITVLGYVFISSSVRLNSVWTIVLVSLGVFAAIMALSIKRLRPSLWPIRVAVLIGVVTIAIVCIPLLIYIGCQYGECINL